MKIFDDIASVVSAQKLYNRFTGSTIDKHANFIQYTSMDSILERIDFVQNNTAMNESSSISYISELDDKLVLKIERFNNISGTVSWIGTETVVEWKLIDANYNIINTDSMACDIIQQNIGQLTPLECRCYYISNASSVPVEWKWVNIEGWVRSDSLLPVNISYVCSAIKPVPSDKNGSTVVMECMKKCDNNSVFLTDENCLC